MTTHKQDIVASDWLSVSHLLSLGLPGIVASPAGIRRQAEREGWLWRRVPGLGGECYEYHIRSLPRVSLEAYAERLLGLDQSFRETLASMTSGVTAGLKRFQREILEARAAILSEIDQLVETGMSCSQAIARFVSDARKGLLPAPVHRLMLQANARSGIKAAERIQGRATPGIPVTDNPVTGTTGRTLSRSTLYLWLRKRALHGLAALAPREGRRGPYVPVWASALLKLYAQPQKPSLQAVMEQLPDHLPAGLSVPSYGQALRFLNRLTAQARVKGRVGDQGLKALKAYVMRDVSELWPGAVYAADGHRFDAEVAHPRHGRPFLPEITSVIDVYSRKLVGWSVALTEDTWGVLDAARHAFEASGLPDIWYVDNGKGFNNDRWDNDLTGFLARMGVSKRNCLPYNSQARGVIERLHQSLWVRSAKSLESFVGKHMDREARQGHYKLSRADIKHCGKTNRVLSWQDFLTWAQAQVDAYNSRPHSFLPRIRDKATFKRRPMTPAEAWQAGIEQHGAPETLSADGEADLYRPYVRRTTRRALVSLFGNRYYHADLEAWHGEQVLVGYDIHDGSKVWVRDREERLIAVATFEGNKHSFFPVDQLIQAREQKLKTRLNRLQHKTHQIHQEYGPAYRSAYETDTDARVAWGPASAAHHADTGSIHTGKADKEVAKEAAIEGIRESGRDTCPDGTVSDVKICPAANVDLSSGLPPSDPLSDLPSGLPSGRPAFATDRDWIIWLMENSDQVNEGDRHRFAGIRHTGSFQLLLKSLEFPFSDIADDIESLFS